jgi:hypothetical protein
MKRIKKTFSLFSARLYNYRNALNDIFYGFTTYELELELRKERGHLDNLLILMIIGDMAGLPLFPPYYSMRILPYLVPGIAKWKRSVLRERDLTDVIATDL